MSSSHVLTALAVVAAELGVTSSHVLTALAVVAAELGVTSSHVLIALAIFAAELGVTSSHVLIALAVVAAELGVSSSHRLHVLTALPVVTEQLVWHMPAAPFDLIKLVDWLMHCTLFLSLSASCAEADSHHAFCAVIICPLG